MITKFTAGTKMHSDTLASYLKARGESGMMEAATKFAPEVKSETSEVNGMSL